MSEIDYKLVVNDTDCKWTEVTKKIINGILDYASKTNEFRTVRIGENTEIDNLPGFYIIFPGLDKQGQIAYNRVENLYNFDCLYTIKGSGAQDALQMLLELHGEVLKKIEQDHDMSGGGSPTVIEVGVPEVHNVEALGFITGSDAKQAPTSHEYIYGATTIQVKTKINLRG